MNDLYKRIKMRREELGLSQEDLAKKLGYKSRSTIAKIESEKNDIPQSKIQAFANALETTPAYLMGWDKGNYKTTFDTQKAEYTSPEYTTNLKRVMEDITLETLEQKTNGYSYDFKNATNSLLADYISKLLPDWFYIGDRIDTRTLNFDLIYLSNTIFELIQNFIDSLIPLIVTYSKDKNILIPQNLNNQDFSKILDCKTQLMNEIESLIDKTISKAMDNLDDLSLYGVEIIEKYNDNKKTPEHLILKAAHQIEGASEEDLQHDYDLMDDNNF